jgi:hypothetical protein
MTEKPDTPYDSRTLVLEALVPLLAFGSTLAAIALRELAGLQFEIQYAAAGGFAASCLLAYLAWQRPRKDIVSLTTPLYGLIFLVTAIDYYSGILLQLFYAGGLTALVLRLHYRFRPGDPGTAAGKDLAIGPLRTYVESTRDALAGADPVAGRNAALAFLRFAQGNYSSAAGIAHAGSCHDGTPAPVVRAFSILRQHAELLDKNEPRPVTYLRFLPEDNGLLAKPLQAGGKADREFEAQMDNALLLLFSAGWHASPDDRAALVSAQAFAQKLLET